jgi:methylated-DNA-[protein]-cysteine S-methyltransferase
MEKHHYHSPVGWLEITTTDDAVTALRMTSKPNNPTHSSHKVILQCCKELDEYFAGKRRHFDVKVYLKGTDFQSEIWKKLQEIPYGKTISYSALAQAAGHSKACRAAGSANGKNPVAIIVPCHRVIAADGSLGGYAYGLNMKKALLDLERMNF